MDHLPIWINHFVQWIMRYTISLSLSYTILRTAHPVNPIQTKVNKNAKCEFPRWEKLGLSDGLGTDGCGEGKLQIFISASALQMPPSSSSGRLWYSLRSFLSSLLPSLFFFSSIFSSFLLLLFLSFTLSTSGILTNFTQSLSSFLTLIFSSLIISDFNYISEILAINKGTELIAHRYLLSIEFILLTLG